MNHGRYEVLERLGEGESAVVYRTRDLAQGGREVAVKVLKGHDERAAARFRREFEVLAGLAHPNLVSVIDFGVDDGGSLYYSSEYHPGQRTLREAVLEAEELPPLAERLAVVVEVLRGLEYVHTRGLVHRDLKPDNVLVDGEGGIRLSDFGLVGVAEGQVAGTPHYIAPEVLRRLRVDRRADLYSLGVILYELLTGSVPYDGRDAAEVSRKHLEDRPRALRELAPDLPEALERIVLRLLEKEPSDRYPSANAVIAELAKATGEDYAFETSETKEAYVLSGRFVGRDRELDWLVEAFGRAVSGQSWDRDPREFDRRARFETRRSETGRERRRGGDRRATRSGGAQNPPALLVLVRGESGLGKTRLLAELRRRCQLEGAVVLAGSCTKHQSRGYEPFVEVLQEAAQLTGCEAELEEHGWAVSQLLSQGEASGGVERLRLIDALAELLVAQSTKRPLVISLEDLQWARGETLELLLHLHRTLVTILSGAKSEEERPRLFVVGSYRPEELHGPELGRALKGLRRDRFFEELTLRPLKADDTAELIRSMLGVPSVPRAFVERVMAESRGEPLFVELLMEELVQRGVVDRSRGLWRLDPDRLSAMQVPSRMHDLVLSWLGRLPSRDLLDWLAVLDRAASPALLSRLTGGDVDATAAALEELVGRRVVQRGPHGYELAHARVRDVVYEAIDEQVLHHARVAEVLEESLRLGAEDEVSLGEMAHHQLEAGAGLEALRWARRAADAAVALGARERACELYTRALQVADDHLALAGDDARAGELRVEKLNVVRALVHELTQDGRYAEARALTMDGLSLARALGDVQAEVAALAALGDVNAALKERDDAKRYFFEALKTSERIAYGKGIGRSLLGLGDLTLGEGRLEEALEYLERSLEFESDLGDERGITSYLRGLANALKRKGAYEEALIHCERALEQDRAGGDGRRGEVATLELLADVHFLRGDYAASLEACEEAIDTAEAVDDKAAVARCLLGLASVHERLGQRPEARRRFDEAQALARRLGLQRELAQALNGLGWTHHQAADYPDALRCFNEATTLWNTLGDKEGYALGLTNLGLSYARRGEFRRAGSCYDAASRVAWEVSCRPAELEAGVGRAAVYQQTGDVGRARELLDKTVLRAREQHQAELEVLALAELARLLAAEGEAARALRAAQRARALAREVTDGAVRARVTLRTAEADLLRGALAPALEALRSRAEWLRLAGDRALAVEAECVAGQAFTVAGDLEAAARAIEDARVEAEARELEPLLTLALLAQGELLLERALSGGRYRPGGVLVASPELGEARARLEAARAQAEACGARRPALRALLGLARVALVEGEEARARERAEEAIAAADRGDGALARTGRLLLAELTAAGGDPDDALVALDDLDPLPTALRLRRAAFRALACERAGRRLEARSSLDEAEAVLAELRQGLGAADKRRLEATSALVLLQGARERAEEAGPGDDAEAPRRRADDGRARGFLLAAREVQAAAGRAAQVELLIDRSLALLGAERGLLVELTEGGEQVARAGRRAPGRDLPEDERDWSTSVVARVASTGEVFVLSDAQGDLEMAERPSVADLELRSVLAAPLRLGGRTRHVLVVEDRESPHRFQPDDRELVEGLCDLAASALERTHLREEAERQAGQLAAQAQEVQRLNAALEAKVAEQTQELDSVKAALEEREFELGARSSYENIVGRSRPMQRVFRLLDKVADTDVPVLIQGESGTGKELVARAVHFASSRKGEPFSSINCAALPESLLEAELFGHVKGAFTGADRDKQGLFEAADGGTLFLDEVGDMPPAMQTKLLRVLQEGEVRPIGSRKPRKVAVRVVSASNKDLRRLVDEGLFRADLFYRLNVVSVALPALRERKEDIPLLVDHLLDTIAERTGGKRKSVERKVVDHLIHYDWPGNVRELENELRRLVALSGGKITERDLSPHIRQRGGGESLSVDLGDDGQPLKAQLEAIEKTLLRRALAAHENNKTRTAKRLGLSRYGFLKKLDKYGLRDQEEEEEE